MLKKINGKSSAGKLFVPSLTIAYFTTYLIETLTGIFLIDITTTFFGSSDPVSIATASQLVTISSIVTVFFGLLLSVLSIRFSHKILLLLGILCITFGNLGCLLAPNFIFMQIFYPIEGIGTIMVNSMSIALVGECLILSKRGNATGCIIAGGPMCGIASGLVITFFFSGSGNWRYYLLWFALPISLIALASVYFGVPSSPNKPPRTIGKETYVSSFKRVLLKRSAAGCLIGCMIRQAGFVWAPIYSATFFRERFGLSLASGALITFGITASFALGSLLGGQLVNRIGRKRLLIATLLASALGLAILPFLPNLWFALIASLASVFINSLGFSGTVNLTLEQVPESRGTMMSLYGICLALGFGLGTGLGGAALALFKNYTSLILTFSSLYIIAVGVYFFLTKDPCRTLS